MAPAEQFDLPVASRLDDIVAAARGGAVVVVAPPGSGKTTLVAPALLDALADPAQARRGEPQTILVQPRRLPARAVARRIAALRGGAVGQEVGYQVRFERCASPETRLLTTTTGVLLRRLLDDEALTGVRCVALDEFHERTLEMDLALGMLWRIRETLRPDLAIAVMSATLDPGPVARLLGDCPVVQAEGRVHPVRLRYLGAAERGRLEQHVADAVREAARQTTGHVLVFLPGVGEIVRCRGALDAWSAAQGFRLMMLYGDLPAEQQDAVLAYSSQRKVILATNVAETSLTIEGVSAVVDAGVARQMRFHADRGLPRLELVPISQAAADQRAGRAGRTGPGVCYRLWEERAHRRRASSEPPEIVRADFSETLLRMRLWGERDPGDFPWLDPPPQAAVEGAERLLRVLGALDEQGRPTPAGAALGRLPAHPRLGCQLAAAAAQGALREGAVAAALLTERDPFAAAARADRGPREQPAAGSPSDVVDRVRALLAGPTDGGPLAERLDVHPAAARRVLMAADQLQREAVFPRAPRADDPDEALRRALLAAFPDRVARLRTGSPDRGLLAGGKGVRIEPPSRVRGAPFFLAIELQDAAGEARARLASAVERDWLVGPLARTTNALFFNPTRQQVEARRRNYWLDLLLDESPAAIEDAEAAAELLAQHAAPLLPQLLPSGTEAAARLRQRVLWLASALPELRLPRLDEAALAESLPMLCRGRRSLEELKQASWMACFQQLLGYERLAEIDRLAPDHLTVPSGNRIALTYEPGRPPVLAVRIQELFGWSETPRLAGGRAPVLLHLLGPNYRPQQITDDLASFWDNTYPEVRKELRRRYPKHAWPEDPRSASATPSGLPSRKR